MRRALSVVLLVLACLLVPLGTLSVWARYEVGDSDRYVATMAPLGSEPAVRGAVSGAVTNAIMEQLDNGPMRSAVERFVHEAVQSFTGTESFRAAWDTANRAAHDAVQEAVDDGTDGPVTIDLAPVTAQVKQHLADDGVPFADRVPVTHTEVTVMDPQDLDRLRQVLLRLQQAGLWPPFAALTFAAAGLALARRGRRSSALAATALGMSLTSAALLAALAASRDLTLDSLPSDVDRPAAGAAYDVLTLSMHDASSAIAGAALLIAACAWLAGRFHGAVRAAVRPRPVPPPAASGMRAKPAGASISVNRAGRAQAEMEEGRP
ncbi:hypothetical protein [Streptomyces sp. NPDC046821]|uniref:hypothetical protein n=1 Tax=Streptomyces sp. NPDC046821 TaxID=3154702 RepID=UPI0034031116